ncbi:hypothetical protein K493DRAFT_313108 [Basidiobolus meristosporus CBS 931.73]|uniref:Uncharacterized protein n=1 Tax=Basidiobolus meristosporus CBS 931.73 TaxID=1314790 RepID=A0A1Y1YPP1_9FUNG|nr:hypothetical protein K493DRAFT_313108 [Basidiobolus meristosporus CBS 931.73]|eukprot:ORX99726.1 hypothetical protein K493DRAFT_313108 [Basidiobolus meristosporus CBS 931.73]
MSHCHPTGAANSAGAAVDPEASEGSPLVHHVIKKRSRKVLHLVIHLALFLTWCAITMNWIMLNTGDINTPRTLAGYSTTMVQSSMTQLALWAMATIFIWVDIRRRAF